jgi:hypothetical protein
LYRVPVFLQAAQQANFEAWKAEETKQLANRRRVLDQQYKVCWGMRAVQIYQRLASAQISRPDTL